VGFGIEKFTGIGAARANEQQRKADKKEERKERKTKACEECESANATSGYWSKN
jgi:hypothetical protein